GHTRPTSAPRAATTHRPATTAAAALVRGAPCTKVASGLRQFVAHAVHGEEISRAARVRLELPPDVLDVGIDRTLVSLQGDPVESVEELSPREDAPGRAGQGREQLELGGGER